MLRRLFNNFSSQKEETSVALHENSDYRLRYSELRYRRLFESAQDGILILDAVTGKIIDVNPFLKKILGYSKEELLEKELWEIGVFKDIVSSKKAFIQLQNKGYIRYKDLPLQTKDGLVVNVEFVSNVYMVDTQKVIQCNIRDITDRKKAEEAIKSRTEELETLTNSQEETKKAMLNVMEDLEAAKSVIELEKVKDEAVLESIGEGLIAVDNDRKIMVVNKSAEKIFGWSAKDLVGKELTSLPLEDESGIPMPMEKRPTYLALVTGKMISGNYIFVRKNKTRVPIAINVTPIKLGKKIIGAVDIFRDITHEKEIDRSKSEFVSLASHQLRTPLGISKWYIEALKEEGYFKNASEVAKDYLNEIYKSNERLLSLVRELLSISRIDQGKVRDTPKLVNIKELIMEVIKAMSILAAKNNISIHLDFKQLSIPSIHIDPLRFQEMLENLVANAIDYTMSSGSVDIAVEKTGKTILIDIKDTGIGISDEDQKKIFTKFFRTEKAMKKNTEGSGLGLYVAKSYIDGWGGNISVKSAEGKGSTFAVCLPISQKNNPQSENVEKGVK